MQKYTWFERQFTFGLPKGMFPFYLERLDGTIARLTEKTKGYSEEMLSHRLDNKWSVKENIAHLLEVGRISDRRVDEIKAGAAELSPAMLPLTTDYNVKPIAEILDLFAKGRKHSILHYQHVSEGDLGKLAVHPRLKVPMTIVDLSWFDAEHDDHHCVRINEILTNLKKKLMPSLMSTLTDSIAVQKTKHSALAGIDFKNLEFGKHLSDHMFVAEYSNGQWNAGAVVPYADITIGPANLALHYGQSIFEGLKAYRNKDGDISIFRAHKHHQRLLKSLDRMCMPPIPEDLFMSGLKTLIEVDANWLPDIEGVSLYIRPLVFASESRLGVRVADQYKLIIMTSPVGPYLNKPYRLKVEDHYTRSAEGGAGSAKCAGNYGGAFYPTQLANKQGYDQVLWTDHKEHQYLDEAGMMNVMLVINGTLVTPKLSSAILDGVTRDSILTLAKDMGFPTEERRVSVRELEEGLSNGSVTELFGAGTAAVVAPIAEINIAGKDYKIPVAGEISFQEQVKKKLMAIRLGLAPDVHHWNTILPQ